MMITLITVAATTSNDPNGLIDAAGPVACQHMAAPTLCRLVCELPPPPCWEQTRY